MITAFEIIMVPNVRTLICKSEVNDTLVHIRAVDSIWIGDESVDINKGYMARSQNTDDFRLVGGDALYAMSNQLTHVHVYVQTNK